MVKTHKGSTLDINALKEKNQHVVTVGNMKTNARGDLLGPGGKIVKTKEQLATEKYDKKRTKTVKGTAALNAPVNEMLGGKKKPVKFADQQEAKKQSDIETLGKYDLGEGIED
jgi:hypothetical protein